MPFDTPPVIGVEFLALGVRNSDGAFTRIFVTITDAQQRFTVRTVNDSAQPAVLVITNPGGVDSPVTVPAGEKTDWNTANRRYDNLARFEVRAA